MELQINHQKRYGKKNNTQRLNNRLLKNEWAGHEIQETNENETQ